MINNEIKIRDITAGNRAGQTHSGDCGGRLGPVMPDGGPDLRNLQVFSFFNLIS